MNSWRRLLCHPGPYDTQDGELLFFFSSLESGYLAVCFPDSSITTSGTPALLAKRTFFCEGNSHAHFSLDRHGNWCIVYIKLHIIVNEAKNPREPVVYSYDELEASVLTDFFDFFLFRRRRASGEWRWRLWCSSQSWMRQRRFQPYARRTIRRSPSCFGNHLRKCRKDVTALAKQRNLKVKWRLA